MKYLVLIVTLFVTLQTTAQKLPSPSLLAKLTHRDDTTTLRKINDLAETKWAEKIRLYKTIDPISSEFANAQSKIVMYATDSAAFKNDGLEALEKLERFGPQFKEGILALNHLFYSVYDPAKAQSYKAKYERQYPFGYLLKDMMANYYLRKRKHDAFDQMVPELLKIRPLSGQLHNQIARRYFVENLYTEGYIWAMTGVLTSKQPSEILNNLVLINMVLQKDFEDPKGTTPRLTGATKIDEVLQSRLATSKDFDCKCPVQAQDFNQMQLLMQQLKKHNSYADTKGPTREFALAAIEEIAKGENYRTMTTGVLAIFNEEASDRQKFINKHVELISKIQTKVTSLPWIKNFNYNGQDWFAERSYERPSASLNFLNKFEGTDNIKGQSGLLILRIDEDGYINLEGHFQKGEVKELRYLNETGRVIMREIKPDPKRSERTWVTTYWPNGNRKRSYYREKSEVIIGNDTTWFRNGQLESITSMKNGKFEGPTVTYHQNGKPSVSKLTYRDGKRDGDYLTYHDNGQVKYKGSFKNGERTGIHDEFYKSGIRSDQSFHSEGLSWHNHYGTYGNLEWRKRYGNDNKDTIVEYFKNGKISTLKVALDGGLRTTNMNGDRIELIQESDAKGNIKKLISFADDGRQTPQIVGNYDVVVQTPHPSWGLPYEEYSVNNKGLVNGVHTRKLPSGFVTDRDTFENGGRKGIKYSYHPNGSTSLVSNLSFAQNEPFYDYSLNQDGSFEVLQRRINDTIDGRELSYSEDGVLEKTTYYNMGVADGWRIYYERDGKTIRVVDIANDDNYYTAHFYYGGIYLGSISDTVKGMQTINYPNGKPFIKREYANLELTGTYFSYYPNGELEEETSLDQEGKVIRFKEYDLLGLLTKDFSEDPKTKIFTKLTYENGRLITKELQHQKTDSNFIENYLPDGSLLFKERNVTNSTAEEFSIFEPISKKPIVTFIGHDDYIYRYASYDANGKRGDFKTVTEANHVIDIKYPDGKPALLLELKNNARHGKYNIYYSNGQLLRSRTYDHGTRVGKELIYYPNGQPMEASDYVKTLGAGSSKLYFPTGKIRVDYEYETAAKPGSIKLYDEAGKLVKHRIVKYGKALDPTQDPLTTK